MPGNGKEDGSRIVACSNVDLSLFRNPMEVARHAEELSDLLISETVVAEVDYAFAKRFKSLLRESNGWMEVDWKDKAQMERCCLDFCIKPKTDGVMGVFLVDGQKPLLMALVRHDHEFNSQVQERCELRVYKTRVEEARDHADYVGSVGPELWDLTVKKYEEIIKMDEGDDSVSLMELIDEADINVFGMRSKDDELPKRLVMRLLARTFLKALEDNVPDDVFSDMKNIVDAVEGGRMLRMLGDEFIDHSDKNVVVEYSVVYDKDDYICLKVSKS